MGPNFVSAYLLPAAGTFCLAMAGAVGPGIVRAAVNEGAALAHEVRAWLQHRHLTGLVNVALTAGRAAALAADPNMSAAQVEAYAGKVVAPFLSAHGFHVSAGAVQDLIVSVASMVRQDLAKPTPPAAAPAPAAPAAPAAPSPAP